MIRSSLIFLLTLLSIVTYANPGDSLKTILPQLAGQEKVDAIIELWHHIPQNEMPLYLQDALKISEASGYSTGKGAIHMLLGTYYFDLEELKLATQHLDTAEVLLSGDPSEQGIEHLENVYSLKNSLFLYQYDTDRAMDYAVKAMKLAKNNADSISMGFSHLMFAQVYDEISFPDKAIQHLRKAKSIFIRQNAPLNLLAQVYHDVGYYFYNQGVWDSSLYYLVEIEQTLKHTDWVNSNDLLYYQSMGLVADIYVAQGKYEEGLHLAQQILDHYDSTGIDYMRGYTELTLANALLELERNDEVLEPLKSAERIAQEQGIQPLMVEVYKTLKKYYKQQNNLDLYSKYDQLYVSLNDSVNGAQQALVANEVVTEYEINEKQEEIQQLSQSKQKQNRYWLIGGISTLLLVVLFYNLLKRKIKEQKRTLINNNEQLSEKERTLASNSLLIASQKELLQKIKTNLQNTSSHLHNGVAVDLNNIARMINQNIDEKDQWQVFLDQFNQIQPGFFKTLHDLYPELTNYDLRLCAYFRLHMSNREIASLLNISYESVIKARYRLKKKMNLKKEKKVDEYIASL